MKHLIPAAALALLASCGSQPANQYTLNGTIADADGEQIVMVYMSGDSIVSDTVTIADGKFTFTGSIDAPANAQLMMGDARDYRNPNRTGFYIEPAEMTIALVKGDFASAKLSGSATQAAVDSLNSVLNPIMDEAKGADEAKMTEARNRIEELQTEFIKTHGSNPYSYQLVQMMAGRSSLKELETLYSYLQPAAIPAVDELGTEIKALKSIQPGMPAPDLIGVSPDGKEIKLSDYKGKVVLLDFWATWCGPCRASLPHVKSLYDKYAKKGFEVFFIGDDDSNADKWKEVIELEGIANHPHILRGLKTVKDENGNFKDFDRSNDQSEKYAIHYLPTKFLIAADGTIIGKINTDEELDAKLEEIFK